METKGNIRGRDLTGCIFCKIGDERIIEETTSYVVVRDLFPVSKLHTLIIPKRHAETYFDLNDAELDEIPEILNRQRDAILGKDHTVTGFNIGINSGEDAGQTVMHCHIHLIPRRKGDMENPRGGVRGVIPDKRIY